jgi:hypothetical protein
VYKHPKACQKKLLKHFLYGKTAASFDNEKYKQIRELDKKEKIEGSRTKYRFSLILKLFGFIDYSKSKTLNFFLVHIWDFKWH